MNPLKAADAGVLRSALATSDRAAPSSSTPVALDFDWIRGAAYTPDVHTPSGGDPAGSGYAVVLVAPDATDGAERRAQLTAGGLARVITACDAYDVADALRLMDPDVVIVSTAEVTQGSKLIRAVRAQFDAHHEPVPILAWASRLLQLESPSALLAAGADAVLDEARPIDEVFATVRALRRVIASATRRTSRQIARTPTVLDALQASVALVDRDGRVAEANAALQRLWREMTGQRVSPVGGDLAHLLVPSDRGTLADAIAALFSAPAGAVTDLECSLGTSPVRGIPVHLHLARLEDSASGPVVVAQISDLRERRRMEEQVRANRWRALDRQQTLDLADRLRGLLSTMTQALGTPAGSRFAADQALSSTHAALVRGLLAQSEQLLDGIHAIASELEHPASLVDVCTLVDAHLALFQQMLPAHVVLTWEVGGTDLMVRGSELQLQQVLTALVMNAWDVQRSGGAIHVSVRHTDEVVVIGVEDRGPGVPEERAEWIFLPMTTTRVAEGASGFGLVTARRSVEMHGGQLRLDRYREVGAKFEIILPRYRSRVQATRTPILAVLPQRTAAGL